MDHSIDGTRPTGHRRPVDGLIVSEHEVWVVVGEEADAALEWLRGDDPGAPLTLCRGFADPDHVWIGPADPSQDRLLSELFSGEERGQA